MAARVDWKAGDATPQPKAGDAAHARLQIEYCAVDDLIPYARNARTHSDAQVALIAGSIREFGFTNPVLVDGENGIIAGHGRVLAARKLGLATVPVIELATSARRRSGPTSSPTTSSPSRPAGTGSCWRWRLADLPALGVDLGDARLRGGARSTRCCAAARPIRARRTSPSRRRSRSRGRAISGCSGRTG